MSELMSYLELEGEVDRLRECLGPDLGRLERPGDLECPDDLERPGDLERDLERCFLD